MPERATAELGAGELRLIVFDCDGTLVDSQAHIVLAMRRAFEAVGLEGPVPAEVRAVIGLELGEAVGRLLPRKTATSVIQAVAAAYRTAFFSLRQRPDHLEPLFPGAAACLDELQQAGFLLGVATGKARRGLIATLGSHGLLARFTTLQTADDAPGKPHPAMLRQAMAAAGAEPARTVLVGDTSFDMQMARNAGVHAVGVAWGYHPVAALSEAGAACVIAGFDELPRLAAALTGAGPCA